MLYGAEKLAGYDENPSILAQAAHGKCGKPFNEYSEATQNHFISLFPASQTYTAITRAKASASNSRATLQDLFISRIVELRAQRNKDLL